jgi:ABC-type glycerol-3-phosphate transport system permease component
MTSASTALPGAEAARFRRRGGDRRRAGLGAYLTLGTVASIVFVLPLAWAVFRSLLPSTLVTSAPSTADVHHLTFANYSGLIHGGILHYALNSLLVAAMTAAATAVVATMASYGFARFRFLQIPWELSEQAAVDGASATRTLVSVLRPLVVPGIATTVLYAFLFSWTEFVGALTFLTSNDLYTLPLALLNMEYGSVGQVNFGYLEAGAVIAMIPCAVLYVALQRYYIRGLTSGVVKG